MTNRAILSTATGGPETLVLGELPVPVAGPGQLLVRTAAVALNYPDALIIEDRYQVRPERPFAPGCELSGVVEAVGAGVEGFSVGDRIIAIKDFGALAECVAVDVSRAFRIPDAMPFDTAAALLLTYGTTIYALASRAALKPGETLLVLGASGGVGLAAVELGKAMGATVVAGTSSPEKCAIATQAGADRTVVYPRGPFDKDQSKALAALFKDAVGAHGADVVYDPLGGGYSEPAIRAIAWNGRFLVIGFVDGIAKLPLNLPLLKECSVVGTLWGEFTKRDPEGLRAQVDQLFALWAAGKIKPYISEHYPFERAADALADLGNRRAIGKLVVTVDPTLA
jgi:NADPH:quinone reductase-like Zn-dependent oxidoreductase